jgi:hypothetical protein
VLACRIHDELDVSRAEAKNTLFWVRWLVKRALEQKDATFVLTKRMTEKPEFRILKVIMQQGKDAEPGSIHEAVQRWALDERGGTLNLRLTRRDRSRRGRSSAKQVCLCVVS